MSGRIWSLYRLSDGCFIRRLVSTDPRAIEANIPDGYAAIEGQYDHACQRVDLTTGKVVDYQPPQPSEDHEWNVDVKRWMLKPEVARKRVERDHALRDIEALEVRKLRPLGELALNPEDTEARARLEGIEQSLRALREKL